MKFLLLAPYGTLYLSPHPAGSLATDPIPSIQSTPIIANSDLRWYSLSELLHWVHVLQFKTKKTNQNMMMMMMIMLIILMMIQICFRGGHLTSRLSLKELNDRLEKYIGSMDMLPQSPNHTITRWIRWWWSWQGWSWSWWYELMIMMISKRSLRNMEMLPGDIALESRHHTITR